MDFFNQIGVFIYPLILCSFLGVYISCERIFALRKNVLFPDSFIEDFLDDKIDLNNLSGDSLARRLVLFFRDQSYAKDEKILKAFVRLEIGRLEKGLFILEAITAIAPLVGLLGTVFGLTNVFGTLSFGSDFSNPSAFVSGIALALNTTILGLLIAIPFLAVHSFLLRKIELISQNLDLCIETLLYKDRI